MITEILQQLIKVCLQLLGQPFFYMGILFVILQYRRQTYLERKMFNTKLHSSLHEVWKTLLWSVAAGFAASIVMAFFGTAIQEEAVFLIWGLALLLILVRVRFICFAYAIGLVGMLHAAAIYIPTDTGFIALDWLTAHLLELKISSLLALVAIVHVIEALYIHWHSSRSASPICIEGKRGRIVGGYQIQGYWALPLFLVVPVEAGAGLSMAWTPLLGGDLWANGWMLLAFPVMIGYSEFTQTLFPKVKTSWSSKFLWLYSFILLALAFGVEYWSPLTFAASLLCILLHEAIMWYSSWKETQQAPLYVNDTRGLFILGMISGSPAEEMGIQPGEIIHQVNGLRIKTKDQLHEAFRMNPAFCRLEIINLEGHSKFLKRAMYENEHHQLGLILAPDKATINYLEMKPLTLRSFINMKFSGISRKNSSLQNYNHSTDDDQQSDADKQVAASQKFPL